jgi:hypothetical protein
MIYHWCDGFLSFKQILPEQLQYLEHLASEINNHLIRFYIHNNQITLDIHMPLNMREDRYNPVSIDFSQTIRFLAQVAQIVQHADGEIDCAISVEIGYPSWHYYSIRDSKLYQRFEDVERSPALERVGEIKPEDWNELNCINYDGMFCLPNPSNEQWEQVKAFAKRNQREIVANCVNFTRYASREQDRWLVRLMMDFAQLVGNAEGEIECAFDTLTDINFYEFYTIQNGALYRQRGRIHKTEAIAIT